MHRPLGTLALAAALLGARPARADDGLRWNEAWPRFSTSEYATTVVSGVSAIIMYTYLSPQAHPHYTGGWLFDDAVRDALRVRDASGLRRTWQAADFIGIAGVVTTVGVDSVLVPLLRGSPDVAWQLGWIDLESYSLSSVLTFTLYDSVGRARPSYADCQRDPRLPYLCNTSPTASFPSGHVAEAFVSAGLSCAHHTYAGVYGNSIADAFACARDLTLATADGVLRIMGDRHWTTDALAGAALGFSFGYVLPVLVHYRARTQAPRVALAPMTGGPLGVVAAGTF